MKVFIEEHHRKTSKADFKGLLADYAAMVDFLDKGRIPQGIIAAEERSHRERWPTGNETSSRCGSMNFRSSGGKIERSRFTDGAVCAGA